jgi:hypothetical protein
LDSFVAFVFFAIAFFVIKMQSSYTIRALPREENKKKPLDMEAFTPLYTLELLRRTHMQHPSENWVPQNN